MQNNSVIWLCHLALSNLQSYYHNIEGVYDLKILIKLLDASDIYCLEIATTISLTGNAIYFCLILQVATETSEKIGNAPSMLL